MRQQLTLFAVLIYRHDTRRGWRRRAAGVHMHVFFFVPFFSLSKGRRVLQECVAFCGFCGYMAFHEVHSKIATRLYTTAVQFVENCIFDGRKSFESTRLVHTHGVSRISGSGGEMQMNTPRNHQIKSPQRAAGIAQKAVLLGRRYLVSNTEGFVNFLTKYGT